MESPATDGAPNTGVGRSGPVLALVAMLGLSGCAMVSPTPSATPASPTSDGPPPSREPATVAPSAIGVVPFEGAAVDVAAVQRALLPVVPDLSLVPYRDPDGLGVFPPSSFANQGSVDRVPRIGRVLVFPSPTERIATEPRFGGMTIRGSGGTLTWDGPTHSEWIGGRNVIVEVVMPGGTFGKVTPWTDADRFAAAVRSAVGGL